MFQSKVGISHFIICIIIGSYHFSYGQQLNSNQFNLKISGLGSLAGFTIFEIDYRLSSHWWMGLGYTQISATQTNKSIQLTGFKIFAHYYFTDSMKDDYWLGFYNGTNRVAATAFENDQLAHSNLKTNSFGLRGGYHWWWENLNLSLGYSLGASVVSKVKLYDSEGTLIDKKDQGSLESGPELFLGYRF